MKISGITALTSHLKKRPQSYRDLIRREAKIGGSLFGQIPPNHRREFFCLDERTWVWHEEWLNEFGKLQNTTTRFEVHNDRVLKVQNGQYYKVDSDEALNLYRAAVLYNQKIRTEIYAQAA